MLGAIFFPIDNVVTTVSIIWENADVASFLFRWIELTCNGITVLDSQSGAKDEDFYSFVSHNSMFFFFVCLYSDPLKRLSFSICLWMFNLRVVCVYKRATCNLAALSQDILSQHGFFSSFHHYIGAKSRTCVQWLHLLAIHLDRLGSAESGRNDMEN